MMIIIQLVKPLLINRNCSGEDKCWHLVSIAFSFLYTIPTILLKSKVSDMVKNFNILSLYKLKKKHQLQFIR